MNIARRFNATDSGFQEVTAWIPGGKPKSVQLNPDWQTAEYEELPDGRIVTQQEAYKVKKGQ